MISAALLLAVHAGAQDSANAAPVQFSGYTEAYYSYDFNRPDNNIKAPFLYNHNRHNEFNINLAFVKAAYAAGRVRANLALGAGTYMNANYAAEPGVLKNIFEANAGYKLSAVKNLWLDVGVLPSHIGFESAIGKDNWTLTRSLVAENTPYFESGARLQYTTDNGKWQSAAFALNGWQRIARIDGNSLMSWGTQVVYKPSENLTLNYSTFIGTDKPDSNRLMRYHNNLYGIIKLSEKAGFIAGIDYGLEQKKKGSPEVNTWYTPAVMMQIVPGNKWAIALRGEYLSDPAGVIISTGTPNGFRTWGVSANVDYMPVPNVALRLECRNLNSKDALFLHNGSLQQSSPFATFAIAVGY